MRSNLEQRDDWIHGEDPGLWSREDGVWCVDGSVLAYADPKNRMWRGIRRRRLVEESPARHGFLTHHFALCRR